MGKTDARVRYTKRVLKDSLLKLLTEKPINKITVTEVCELAELNRATFYSHYSDCFALLESIEDELVEAFRRSLEMVTSFDIPGLIGAIYGILDQHKTACDVLIFKKISPSVLRRMIDIARERSMYYWKKELIHATDEQLDMLYIHLSNGLLRVVLDGYSKYSREDVTRFVDQMVTCSLEQFR